MCFIPMTNIVFDVYGMNPLKIKILRHTIFTLMGFRDMVEGRVTVLCPN